MKRLRMILGLGLVLAVTSIRPCYGQKEYQVPVIQAVQIVSAPTIDGLLDEPCWQELPKLEDFYCSEFDKTPTEKTEVLLGYDKEVIFVGFRCFDSAPEKIVATETKRGGSLRNDDHVSASFDTFHQHKWGQNYEFRVSAIGTQDERIPGGGAAKIEYRGDWQAAAKITEAGWTAEMKIPFSILKYPPGQIIFGISFSRYLSRQREEYSWPNMGKSWELTKVGDWLNLKVPEIKNPIILMPYTMGVFEEGQPGLEYGLDLKHTLPSGLTLASTFYPDNRSIEDILGLEFSYTERFVRDNRPFFAEGGGGWRGGFFPDPTVFHSRNIEQFDWGLKAFGTLSQNSLGFLSTGEFGGTQDIVAKLQHDLSQYLSLTGIAVSHRLENEDNLVTGMASNYYRPLGGGGGFSSGITHYQSSGEGLSGSFTSASLGLWPGNGQWGGGLSCLSITPDFAPALGFVPETDLKGYSADLTYYHRKAEGPLENISFNSNFGKYHHQDGLPFHQDFSLWTGVDFRDSIGVSLGFFKGSRFEDEDLFHDQVISLGANWNRYSSYKRGGLGFDWGRQAGADYQRLSLSQGFRPTEKLGFALSYEQRLMDYDDGLTEKTDQLIATFNYDLTSEKTISGRLVKQDSNFNAYLAYRQSPRKGMDLFVIFGDPNAETFQPNLIIKAVWVFPLTM